jgi:hypothetical protein
MTMERRWALIGHVHGEGAVLDYATCEEADAGVIEDKVINPKVGACSYDRKRVWGQHEAGKGTETVLLTPAAGIVTIDGQLSNVFYLELGANVTEFANPVNPINGQTVNIHLRQDVAGGRVIESWGDQWKFTNKINPELSTEPNAIDLLSCQWNEIDSIMQCSFLPNYGSDYDPPPVVDIGDLTCTNLGGGNEVFKERVLNDLKFRTIVAEGDVDVTTVGDTIVVSYTTPTPVESPIENFDDLLDVDASSAVVGDTIVFNGTEWVAQPARRWTVGATWTNGPNALIYPVNDVNSVVSEKCAIVGWYLLTDGGTGSCEVDILRVPVNEFPPLGTDTICGGNEPAISTATMDSDFVLTGWDVDCEEGDLLQFKLLSTSTFNTVQIILVMEKRA